MKRHVRHILGLSAFAAACMATGMGLSYGWQVRAQDEKPVTVDAKGLDRMPPIAEVAEKLNPTVVAITNTSYVRPRQGMDPFGGGNGLFDFFFGPGGPTHPQVPRGGAEQREISGGSGVIISPDGEILTNYHVVANAGDTSNNLEVKTADGRTFTGTVLGKDKDLDIALVKIKADHLPFAKLGNSDSVKIGEWVVAIGNPLGLEHTVTQGIISAKGRRLDTGISSFLQTDAAINRGNSGGPLLNLRGEVVGINTAINPAGQNIGFAVPISSVNRILPDLRAGKPVSRGYLGVLPQELDSVFQQALGVKQGVLVGSVEPGQAADKAGIQHQDVITTVDGKAVNSPDDLVSAIAGRRAGDTVKLGIIRNGKPMTFSVVLGDRKAIEQAQNGDSGRESEGGAGHENGASSFDLNKAYGFSVGALDPANRHQYGVADNRKGVVVISVDPRSPAADRNLQSGLIITEANGQAIHSVADLAAVARKAGGKPLLLYVEAPQGSVRLTLAIPAR